MKLWSTDCRSLPTLGFDASVRGNSKLVVDQVMKQSTPRDPKMMAYCEEVRHLKERFGGFELHHVLRHDNEAADFLAKLASS